MWSAEPSVSEALVKRTIVEVEKEERKKNNVKGMKDGR